MPRNRLLVLPRHICDASARRNRALTLIFWLWLPLTNVWMQGAYGPNPLRCGRVRSKPLIFRPIIEGKSLLVASSVPYHAGTREGLRSYLICFDLEWASGLRVTLSMPLSLSHLLLDSAEISGKNMQFPIKFASVKIDFFSFPSRRVSQRKALRPTKG